MISYTTYKFLHLSFILLFFSTVGLGISQSLSQTSKKWKILFSVMSLLIFVAGMGLIARLGFKHSEPFPLWVILKMINWLFINIAIYFALKSNSPKHKKLYFGLSLFLGLISIWVVVNKVL